MDWKEAVLDLIWLLARRDWKKPTKGFFSQDSRCPG
jgi:hypothetical protein